MFATKRAGVVPRVVIVREVFAVGDAEYVERRFGRALLLARDRVISDVASLVAAKRRSVRERREEFWVGAVPTGRSTWCWALAEPPLTTVAFAMAGDSCGC